MYMNLSLSADYVFSSSVETDEIYFSLAKPIILSVMEGFNGMLINSTPYYLIISVLSNLYFTTVLSACKLCCPEIPECFYAGWFVH